MDTDAAEDIPAGINYGLSIERDNIPSKNEKIIIQHVLSNYPTKRT
jgi:hypothetical protein